MRPTTVKPRPRHVPTVPRCTGELSGGTSPATPTFSSSTSWRTSTDRQYAHVVWTAPDQRKTIAAPQFGQVAVRPVTRLTERRPACSGGRGGARGRAPPGAAQRGPPSKTTL